MTRIAAIWSSGSTAVAHQENGLSLAKSAMSRAGCSALAMSDKLAAAVVDRPAAISQNRLGRRAKERVDRNAAHLRKVEPVAGAYSRLPGRRFRFARETAPARR